MEILAAFLLVCGVVFGTIEVVEHVKCERHQEQCEDKDESK